MTSNDWQRAGYMLGTGLLMGGLFISQSRSVSQANIYYNRESRVSVFREIQIAKKNTQGLTEQVEALEKELAASSDRETLLENIRKEIETYRIMTGELAASGEGVRITISGALETLWLTDLVNELLLSGAEAISINGIRYDAGNTGFDALPNGQILFKGEILATPFVFEAIGDKNNLTDSMKLRGAVLSRIQSSKPDYLIKIESLDKLNLKSNIKPEI